LHKDIEVEYTPTLDLSGTLLSRLAKRIDVQDAGPRQLCGKEGHRPGDKVQSTNGDEMRTYVELNPVDVDSHRRKLESSLSAILLMIKHAHQPS
jgi:hypothetical protein